MRASAILLAAALAAVWAATSPAAAASAEAGRQLAQRNCAMCHAIGRQGASPFAAAPPFRTLHERYPVENLQEALAEGILTGHPAMPEFRFSPGEVNDLIAYLRSLQQDAVPSAAAKGR